MNLTHHYSELCQITGSVSAYSGQYGYKLFVGFSSFALGFSTFSFRKGIFALFVDIFLVSKTVFGTW